MSSYIPEYCVEQFTITVVAYFDPDGLVQVVAEVEQDDERVWPPRHEVFGALVMAKDIIDASYEEG